MAQVDNVSINIGSSFDAKGFKQAESATTKLNNTIKNLAGTIGVAYGTQAVVNFAKESVKAYLANQKATTQLANTVKNLGFEVANADIQKFVEELSLASGVAKESLIPGMQKLLQVTGNVAKSQSLLKTAIDVSRGSGVDLTTVVGDLANAYVGNNRGLKKYGLGLTAAQLKVASFNTVLAQFNRNFAGASQANLQTTAGKFDLLTNAAREASVIIGGGLVDAFNNLSSGGSVAGATQVIIGFANALASLERGAGTALGVLPTLLDKIKAAGKSFFFGFAGQAFKVPIQLTPTGKDKTVLTEKQKQAVIAKAEADNAKRQKALLDQQVKTQKALTAEQQKQAQLKKDSGVFDMQQIELIAALKGNLSEDDRKRAELQLALLNGNLDEADKLTKQILMAQDSTGNLYKYFLQIGDATIKNPFGYLDQWIKDFQTKLNNLQIPAIAAPSTGTYTPAGLAPELAAMGVVAGYGAGIPMTVANQASTTLGNGLYGMQTVPDVGGNGSSSAPVIYNYFGGSVVTDQKLIDQVMNGTQLASLSGSPSQIGRIAGMFG
jgi:chemotaxis protein histidine kinase CheA